MAYNWSGMKKLSKSEVIRRCSEGELAGCYKLYDDGTEALIEEPVDVYDIWKHMENGGEFGFEIGPAEFAEDVGSYELDADGKVVDIKREFFGQGMVFKSWDAYYNRQDDPCYVPELSDTVYTGKDILRVCNGQKEFADVMFESLEWQHPETLLSENLANSEWVRCQQCGTLIDYGDGCNDTRCPVCHREIEEEK